MAEKEINQNVTQLTDEEIEAVNGGDGFLSNIEYVRCIKCGRKMGVRHPGDEPTKLCIQCVKKYKYHVK